MTPLTQGQITARAVKDGKYAAMDVGGTDGSQNRQTSLAFGTGGAVTVQVQPFLANAVVVTVPVTGAPPTGVGFRIPPTPAAASAATDAPLGTGGTALASLPPQELNEDASWSRSLAAQTLSVGVALMSATAQTSAQTTITVIAFHMTSATAGTEIGRGSTTTTVDTASTDALSAVTIPATTFAFGETLALEVYVTAPGIVVTGQTMTMVFGGVAAPPADIAAPSPAITGKVTKTASGSAEAAHSGGTRRTLAAKGAGASSVATGTAPHVTHVLKFTGTTVKPSATAAMRTTVTGRLGGSMAALKAGGAKAVHLTKTPAGGRVISLAGSLSHIAIAKAGSGTARASAGGSRLLGAVVLGGATVRSTGTGRALLTVPRHGGGAEEVVGTAQGAITTLRLGGANATATATGHVSVGDVRNGGARTTGAGGGSRSNAIVASGGARETQTGSGVLVYVPPLISPLSVVMVPTGGRVTASLQSVVTLLTVSGAALPGAGSVVPSPSVAVVTTSVGSSVTAGVPSTVTLGDDSTVSGADPSGATTLNDDSNVVLS